MAFSSSVIVDFRILVANWMKIWKQSSEICMLSNVVGMSAEAADSLKFSFSLLPSCLTLSCMYQANARKALAYSSSLVKACLSIPFWLFSMLLTYCLKWSVNMLFNSAKSKVLLASPTVRQLVLRWSQYFPYSFFLFYSKYRCTGAHHDHVSHFFVRWVRKLSNSSSFILLGSTFWAMDTPSLFRFSKGRRLTFCYWLPICVPVIISTAN